jgi:dephospho-CoA kinase
MTFVLGLTGSIGMGKSATAELFRARGVPVFDADATVHQLYADAALPLIEAAFPSTTSNGQVDRAKLGDQVLGKPDQLKKLEAIIHPLVRKTERQFLDGAVRAGRPLVVLDIPLLFESSNDKRCDAVLVVSAKADVQKSRVLARPGMTEERFQAILARQMPDSEKRKLAHFVIFTENGVEEAGRNVDSVIRALAARQGHVAHRTIQGEEETE